MAAGLAPETFWRTTPREWAIWLDGAQAQAKAQHRQDVVGVWVGTHADLKGIESYLAGEREPLEGAALDRQLVSISADLPVIDLATYLQSKGSN